MKNKTIIGICIMIILAFSVTAIDTNKFNDLRTKLYQGIIDENGKADLRNLAYSIVDDAMSAAIEKLEIKTTNVISVNEEGIQMILDYKQELVTRNIQFKDCPKTWTLIKELLPGDTSINTGLDQNKKDMQGTYRVRTTPESGTTFFLKPNQNMQFSAEVEALDGTIKDVGYCWIDDAVQQLEVYPTYNFRKEIPKPNGVYYLLQLKILKNPKVTCDKDAAIIGEYEWKIQVGDNESKYESKPRIAKYIPSEQTLDKYTDEATTFKAIVENENQNVNCEWSVDGNIQGVKSCSFLLDKCEKEQCMLKVTVKEGTTTLENGDYTWTINTHKEEYPIKIFPDIPLFPKDQIELVYKQNGNKVDFETKITDKLYQYYKVIDKYEWNFNGDLRYDRTTDTKATSYDYSQLPKGTYKVTVKVPIVLSDEGKDKAGADFIKNNPMVLQVHYAQAQNDVTVEGKPAEIVQEPNIPLILDCDAKQNVSATTCKCEGKLQTIGFCCEGKYQATVTKAEDCPKTITAATPTQPVQPKPPVTPPPAQQSNPQIKDLQSILKQWNPKVQENGALDATTKALITEAVNYYANKPGAEALKTITQGGITQQKILQNYDKVKKIVNDYVFLKTM